MRKPPLPPLLVLSLGILAVSAASIMIRFAQREAPSLVVAAWRLLLAALVLAPFAATRRRAELSSLTGRERLLALASGVFLALHFATWISSLAYTSVASSVVLVATAPLWVAVLSPITLKERLSQRMLAGLLLALAGSFVVSLSDNCTLSATQLTCPPLGEFVRGRAFWGDMLALAGALFAAGYLIIGRSLRKNISLLGSPVQRHAHHSPRRVQPAPACRIAMIYSCSVRATPKEDTSDFSFAVLTICAPVTIPPLTPKPSGGAPFKPPAVSMDPISAVISGPSAASLTRVNPPLVSSFLPTVRELLVMIRQTVWRS